MNRKAEFNSEGYLVTPWLWDEELAVLIARKTGIMELNENHWAVIYYVRKYWEKNRTAPLISNICRFTSIRLSAIYELFPMGPVKGVCRIAGLPKPDGCV